MHDLNATHDPTLESWVESANEPRSDFPIQNLPFASFRCAGSGEQYRCGVAIGAEILDLALAQECPGWSDAGAEALAACNGSSLDPLLAVGAPGWARLRAALSEALRRGSALAVPLRRALLPQRAAEFRVPVALGDFTDFYASVHHATTVGKLFRPDNPLLPNYKWVPIAYHGRASSVRVSGYDFHRPLGQVLRKGTSVPVLAPSERLDYELEVGMVVGTPNELGRRVPLDEAERHVFGLCLLNDWSARDLQAWEYQPLGPFLAKNFLTSISPWLVTLEALAPFRAPWTRPASDPQPLPYLDGADLRSAGAFDIELEVLIETAAMRKAHAGPQRLSRSNFRHSYWSVSQMLAHHTVNGCDLRAGDLLGSGTQSGPLPEEGGCLLELSAGGARPIELANGERRTFLADGDRVVFRGWCERAGFRRIGFGEVSGTVLPASEPNSA